MRLQREHGGALIFISHNLAVVRPISRRILVLYLGRMMELADRDAIYENPRHPYTQALISAVPIPDPRLERQKRRLVAAGEIPSPLAPPTGCVFRTRCPAADATCEQVPPLETLPGDFGRRVACWHPRSTQPPERATP